MIYRKIRLLSQELPFSYPKLQIQFPHLVSQRLISSLPALAAITAAVQTLPNTTQHCVSGRPGATPTEGFRRSRLQSGSAAKKGRDSGVCGGDNL
jgi:hypothetical protein